MFQELVNKRVICCDVGILQFMYPNFKIVRSKNEIFDDTPFIYIGNGLDIRKIEKYDIPHIIVSNAGDYDFNDRETLVDLAYQKYNKEISNKDYLWINSSYNDFIYNWKHLWVMGELPSIEIEIENIFHSLIEYIDCPILFYKKYWEKCIDTNVDRIEEVLLHFILGSIEGENRDDNWLYSRKQVFLHLYRKNLNPAINKHFKRCKYINDKRFRLFELLYDIINGCDDKYEIHYQDYLLMHKGETNILDSYFNEKKYLIDNIKKARKYMTTIVLGKLGCKLFKELYNDDIYTLKTINDVKYFRDTFNFATDQIIVFEDISLMSPVVQGALLKFIEETKRPIIALCSKDDVSGALMSRFMKKVKLEYPLEINEMKITDFIRLKKKLQHNRSMRRYEKNIELLIANDTSETYLRLCPTYWHIKEDTKLSNITLLDEKIYLMCS